MARVVSRDLPRWPTDRLRRKSQGAAPFADTPLVLAGRDSNRRVFMAADRLAEAVGLSVAPHSLMELSLHLLCGVENEFVLENIVGGSFTELRLSGDSCDRGRYARQHERSLQSELCVPVGKPNAAADKLVGEPAPDTQALRTEAAARYPDIFLDGLTTR